MSEGVRESLPFRLTDVPEGEWMAFLATHQPAGERPSGWRSGVSWLLVFLLGAVAIYASYVSGGWLRRFGENLFWLVVGAALSGAVLFGWLWLVVRANRQAVRQQLEDPKGRWANGPWRVRVSPGGLTRMSAEATLHYNWSVVNSIEVADNFVFFFTGINEGHFVPRTAFEYDEDFRSFVRQARRLREDADRYPLAEAADVEASEGIQPARDVTGTRARPGSPPTAP